MGIFKKDKKRSNKIEWKIIKKFMNLILECAKSSFPNELGGLLRIDKEKKDTIAELVMIPGTISGDAHAIFRLHMLPIDFSIVGTVHSHPSYSNHPSEADIHFFRKTGKIHIIVANPFNTKSWKAYDFNGDEIDIFVI